MAERTIEILLQIKQSGKEAIDQLGRALKDLTTPASQATVAFNGLAREGQQAVNGITVRMAPFQRELKLGAAVTQAVAASISASFSGIAIAAEVAWGAITFGISGVIKVFSTLLSFLNPFKLQGLLTGVALGGTGLLAKQWLDAADGAETYRKRLGIVINDQAIANRIFDDFEAFSQKSGIEAEQLAATFARLYDLRVKDAQGATKALAGVAALLQTDLGELTDVLNAPNARGLSRFGINLDDLGKQVRLQSGNITKLVDNTEQSVRQGIIDLFAEKFPEAIAVAGNSFKTQMAIMRVNLGQFAQDFGAILLPAAVGALQKINAFLEENRGRIVAVIRSIPEIAHTVYDEVARLLDSGKIATTLAPLVGPLQNLVENLIANLLRVLIAGLKLLAVPFVAVWKTLLNELQAAWEIFAQNLIPTMINAVKRAISEAGASPTMALLLQATAPGLLEASQGPDLKVKRFEESARDFVKRLDAALDQSVKDAKGAVGELRGAFGDLFDYLRQDSADVWGVMRKLFGVQFSSIVQTVQGTLTKMRQEATANRSEALPTIAPVPADSTTLARIAALREPTAYGEQVQTIQEKYRQELQEFKNLLAGREHGEELLQTVTEALRRKELDEIREVDRQRIISANQAVAAIATGYQQMVQQNRVAYLQDLANWEKRLAAGEITLQQFDAIHAALVTRMEQQNRAAFDQVQAARDQADILILQSQHRLSEAQVQQLHAETEAKLAELRRQHEAGLLEEERYSDAVLAVKQTMVEKEKAINGTFFEGMTTGFQQAIDGLKTPAQAGIDIANKVSDGIENMFLSITSGSKSASRAFKEFAASLLQDLAKMVYELLVKQQILGLLKSLFGAIGGGVSGIFGGGGGADVSGLGNALGGDHALNRGGIVGFLRGGFVPGTGPDRDSVPALLTPGEFVVRRRAVEQPGVLGLLHSINSGMRRFSVGGMATAAGMPAPAAAGPGQVAHYQPVIVADDSMMRMLMNAGFNGFIDVLRQNKSKVKAVLQ